MALVWGKGKSWEGMTSSMEKWVKGTPLFLSKQIRPYSLSLADAMQKIEIDAPVTISFCFICVVVQLFNFLIGDNLLFYFCVPSFSHFPVYSVVSYVRMVTSVVGHTSWDHLFRNMVNILLVGPACETHFGGATLIKIATLTALASSTAFILFGPANSSQLGASGVVFTLILLGSLVRVRDGYVPLTFICQALIWCTKELVGVFFFNDNISHIAHIAGAVVGTMAGYHLKPRKSSHSAPFFKRE
jgi:membrane associated rhomboid family serine protease